MQSVTSRSRDFCQFFSSLGIVIGKFGLVKKVSVSESTNLVSLEKSRYCYSKIWSRKKSLGIGLRKFGLGKKVSVSVSENLVSEKKSWYWYRKNLSRIKKSRSRYQSKFWSRHTVWCIRSRKICGKR